MSNRPLFVVITGFSGAGLSTALKALQDNGFYCIDNLPVEMLWETVSVLSGGRSGARAFALGMDIRDFKFASSFPALKAKLEQHVRLDTVFLNCDPQVILQRYSTARRRHPLLDSSSDIRKAVENEAQILAPVLASADAVIDTSLWLPKTLIESMVERYRHDIPRRTLGVTFVSFGFKFGELAPVELLFDLRFIPNPYFIPTLKHKTGLDNEVKDYIFSQPDAQELLTRLADLLSYLLPKYHQEGKHYLRIGLGCTGGQHRSVAFAEKLSAHFSSPSFPFLTCHTSHRDLEFAH